MRKGGFFLRGENVLLQFGILGILILFNAFFAASEVAIISLSQASTQMLTKRKTRRAAALKALLDDSGRFLATVQIGVTFAGFLASAFAAEAFSDRITTWLESLGLTVLSHERMDTIVVIVITVLLSYVSLVFGELVPKKLGIVYAEVFSYNAALPINGLARLSTPFSNCWILPSILCCGSPAAAIHGNRLSRKMKFGQWFPLGWKPEP